MKLLAEEGAPQTVYKKKRKYSVRYYNYYCTVMFYFNAPTRHLFFCLCRPREECNRLLIFLMYSSTLSLDDVCPGDFVL